MHNSSCLSQLPTVPTAVVTVSENEEKYITAIPVLLERGLACPLGSISEP